MKYVCLKTCQVRLGNKITKVRKGAVISLEKPHPCFRALEPTPEEPTPAPVNFLKASAAELQESKWTFKEAAAIIKEAYDVDLFKEKGTKKSEIISQIIDARFRAVDAKPLEPTLDSHHG